MRPNQLSMDDPGGLGIFPLIARALMFPPPQTETFERQDAAADRAAKAPERRRGWLERLDRWFWRQQQRDVEAYLAKSSDVYDLEARIRALERNVVHPYY